MWTDSEVVNLCIMLVGFTCIGWMIYCAELKGKLWRDIKGGKDRRKGERRKAKGDEHGK